jgi:hypothetical protein
MTSFKNYVNMKILIAVAWKAQRFPQISTHLMMVEIYSAVTNLKRFKFKSR